MTIAKSTEAEDWRASYRRRIVITDTLAVAWAVTGAQLITFNDRLALAAQDGVTSLAVSYWLVSVLLIGGWMLALHIAGSRGVRVIGTAVSEYQAVLIASLGLFGIVAMLAYVLDVDIARGYLITALPVGVAALIITRALWRRWLKAKRLAGEWSYQVMLVGSEGSVTHLAEQLRRSPASGYHIVGAVIPRSRLDHLPGTHVPVWPNLSDLLQHMDATGADTVAVASSDDLPPSRMQELSWSLEPGRRHLVVAPGLTDVGGPRIHMRPVLGLPLIHVETPTYSGRKLYTKRAFDIAGSFIILLLLLPVLAVVALLVRIDSPGPVFFGQPRIGKDGTEFRMLKFRSMVTNAEELLAKLQSENEGAGVLFKLKQDPRVTKVGRVLRRFSIDELPQLLNVLRGEMSLVGPRPPLLREVEQYEDKVHRRFLVKPGVTGLWQVSGRSDLSWEESVRLDLYYVENWTMTGDLVILWRTARAVVGSSGAY
ncbi:sugar transferase [Naasia lichenicola]|uniref:Sugar transferase n=1 Tax=Naasia lichenicola TaxID=2565933 RepID=A0A4S4FKT4_9MICO|nr:sugar transferase [Naasia lichenicola]THG30768.1 sugar transferase [Naasia lichenicola]THG32005.1 sugar transferase [Naasia lichenicola]